ncbi:hypothetical protein KIW84_036232 [Lathyrus oleraceus]|uniref:Uncharacterized protein n=1 Tax=Pisum sativum TaxID=3888 RepID=A0A9D5B6R2_PEA|nr:hypothetical protein KIW84_036232 [Pisum sativum]
MPVDLKNAGAKYQRARMTLFHDMIHHEIECYVDDMIAKSQAEEGHLVKFDRLRQFRLRLNPRASDSDASLWRETVNSVLDSPRGIYEVYWGSMTSLVEKSMQFTLAKSLPTVKQNIHCLRKLAVLWHRLLAD